MLRTVGGNGEEKEKEDEDKKREGGGEKYNVQEIVGADDLGN